MAKISITDKNSDLIAFQNSSKIHSVTNDFSLGLLKEKVAKSIRELPVQERKLLYLYYYKALTQAEIAKLENNDCLFYSWSGMDRGNSSCGTYL